MLAPVIQRCYEISNSYFIEEFEDTKGLIRIVYRRRTDNTMAKRKSTKGQTTIYKTYIKLKIE
jgi:hypothetical protein